VNQSAAVAMCVRATAGSEPHAMRPTVAAAETRVIGDGRSEDGTIATSVRTRRMRNRISEENERKSARERDEESCMRFVAGMICCRYAARSAAVHTIELLGLLKRLSGQHAI